MHIGVNCKLKMRGASCKVGEERLKKLLKQKKKRLKQEWSKDVTKNRKGLCTSAGVLLQSTKAWQVLFCRKETSHKTIMNHDGRITTAWQNF